MKNITISVDEETYRHARLWADKRGTSISAIVKCILVSLPLRSPSPARPVSPGKAAIQAKAAKPARRARNEIVVSIPSHGLAILRATLKHARAAGTPEAGPGAPHQERIFPRFERTNL